MRKAAAEPRGLAAAETRADAPGDVRELAAAIDADGGVALACYREPFGGNWVVFAALLTLGCAYEKRGKLAGSAYHPVLKRIDEFFDKPVGGSVEIREVRADALLALDDAVGAVVERLRARGFQSQFLRAFVIARVNPLRFKRGARAEFDATIEKMTAAARKMDIEKIKPDEISRAAGPPED